MVKSMNMPKVSGLNYKSMYAIVPIKELNHFNCRKLRTITIGLEALISPLPAPH